WICVLQCTFKCFMLCQIIESSHHKHQLCKSQVGMLPSQQTLLTHGWSRAQCKQIRSSIGVMFRLVSCSATARDGVGVIRIDFADHWPVEVPTAAGLRPLSAPVNSMIIGRVRFKSSNGG